MKDRSVNLPLPHPPAPSELTVVGERRSDPLCLLLLGIDGRYYAYSLPDGEPEPVEPGDDDEWEIEHHLNRGWLNAS